VYFHSLSCYDIFTPLVVAHNHLVDGLMKKTASAYDRRKHSNEMTATTITLEECKTNDGSNGGRLWVVVDSYVLDLTAFIEHHPAGARKIINKRKEMGPDISPNFLDHFGHTVEAFRDACKQYERDPRAPVKLKFRETGDVEVRVIGRIKERNRL
jgi:cytochrome b involved in lipid metabolism